MISTKDATKLGTCGQVLISCLTVGYVPIKNLFEAGPWFLRTFPIKEEESSTELPEM